MLVGLLLLALATGAAVWISVGDGGDPSKPSELVLGSLRVQSANAAGAANLDARDATALARTIAAGRLESTIGTDATKNGRPLTIDDFQVTESQFGPAATMISSADGSFSWSSSSPRDIWVVLFAARDVTLGQLNTERGQVVIQVVFDDSTRATLSANVGAVTPDAVK